MEVATMVDLLADHPDPWQSSDLARFSDEWDVEIIDGTLIVYGNPQTWAPWTQHDLDQLPESSAFEIIDGTLFVNAQANPLHHLVADRLCRLIDNKLSADLVAVREIGIALAASTSTVGPDISVVKRSETAWTANAQPASTVVLVVEVASPTTRTIDRTLKAEKYAEAGIPGYWRVDLDPITVFAYALRAGDYVELARWGAGETVQVDDPLRVSFDPATLLP